MFIALMKQSGIGGWQLNCVVHTGPNDRECDIVFVRQAVVIEIDGWAWHHSADRFNADRIKRNALTYTGRRVLRFT